jgi:hypothetical protein
MVDARPCTADDIVADLVAHGTLEPQQGEAVLHALEPVLVPSHLSTVPVRVGLRRHAAEIAGYLGAVFVALSAVAFLSQSWETVTLLTRALTLVGIAVLTAGMGVGVALEDLLEDTPTLVGLAPATALVLTMVGYRWAPTALGHLTMLGAAEESLVVAGLLVLAIVGAWYLLTRTGVLRASPATRRPSAGDCWPWASSRRPSSCPRSSASGSATRSASRGCCSPAG